jgi:HSP20 family protein
MTYPSWDPFDRFFGDFGWPTVSSEEDGWTPSLDVAETENELVVRVEMPGMSEKDVDINLSRGLLTISGEKKMEKVENETCHCMESCYGKFSRTVRLPFEVEADKVDATFNNGVLRITLPRSEAAKPKKIEIKS